MFSLLERLKAMAFFHEAASSAVLLISVLLVLSLIRRAIRGSRIPADVRRRWLVRSRNATLVGLLVGLVIIWGTEMRSLALSLAAVAAAIAIATKEVLLCVGGAFVRTSSRAFDLGDRIEVAGVRGDVIDLGALTTTVLEVGPGHSNRTGRAVVVPNSAFLSQPVVNETPSGDYLLVTLAVPVSREADWRSAERALLAAAQQECAAFLEEARAHLGRTAAHKGLEPSTVDARVSLRLADPARIDLLVRFPAPVAQRNRVEQSILRRYLETLEAPAGNA